MKDVLKAMGIPIMTLKGFEAVKPYCYTFYYKCITMYIKSKENKQRISCLMHYTVQRATYQPISLER